MAAGGTDTARGIAFQHAQAVGACVDLLESDDAAVLRVEGREDIVDFELRAADGRRLRVCQAKTRQEPYAWAPGAIVHVIERWAVLDKADDAQFEFLTDGSAGPELAEKLQPALRRARKNELTDEDEGYLSSKGLRADAAILKRVSIASRQPVADVLLDRVALRLLRVLEMVRAATSAEAEAAINELFRVVSVRSGEADPDVRELTREEISEIVGVPLDVIDSSRRWDDETVAKYVAALGAEPPHPSFVALEAEPLSLQPDALALVVREQAEPSDMRMSIPAADLLTDPTGGVISGPAGAGKTTTVELLVHAALDRDLLPVAVSAEGYESGSISRLVQTSLERRLAYRLAPGSATHYLNTDGATLLIDGAGELDPEARESLVRDILALRRAHRGLRTVVTGRSASNLRALGLPSFVLQGLTSLQRRQVAAELLQRESEALVAEVESRLGDVVDNPLLFVMALSLARRGVVARTRVELFDGFLEGLSARAGGDAASDVVLALVRGTCLSLRRRGAYAADRWTWLREMAATLERLSSRQIFTADAASADDVLRRAQQAGLVRELPGSALLALTHDLFCDFLAAEAVRLGQSDFPEQVVESVEEMAVFLAERGLVSGEIAWRVASNPVAAARCATAAPHDSELDDTQMSSLYAKLRSHLGGQLRSALAKVRVHSTALADGSFLFVVPEGTADEDVAEANAAANVALRVARVPTGSTPLAGAVALWLAELRLALTDEADGLLSAVPQTRDAMPAALVHAFNERKKHTEELLGDICPALAERALRERGLRGFHAVVEAAQTHQLPIGGGQTETIHPMVFSFNAADVDVRLGDDVSEDFVAEPSTRTACEHWLRDAPLQAALKDTRKTLERLLPGLAR